MEIGSQGFYILFAWKRAAAGCGKPQGEPRAFKNYETAAIACHDVVRQDEGLLAAVYSWTVIGGLMLELVEEGGRGRKGRIDSLVQPSLFPFSLEDAATEFVLQAIRTPALINED